MFIKIVPGLVITVALAVFFCHHGERRHMSRPSRVAVATMPSPSAASSIQYASMARSEIPRAASRPAAFSMRMPLRETPVQSSVSVPASTRAIVRDMNAAAGSVASSSKNADAADIAFMPTPRPASSGIASDSALANQSVWCEEETTFPRMSTAYPELPPKGIYLWGDAQNAEARQRAVGDGLNVYSMKETSYRVGFKYDWSIDSVVGASVELLDAEVKSRQANDSRRNDIDGYVLRGHYDGSLFGKYPVNATAFYGRVDTKGSGIFDAGYRWTEEKHESDYFGFSAKVGLPLVFSNGLKVHSDIGIDYRRLKTGAYSVGVDSSVFDFARTDSTSLMVPLNVTMKKDFPQVWGLVTPKLNFGVAAEFKDSATGLRAWNASGAVFMERLPGPIPGSESLSEMVFEPSTKTFGKLGVGMDMKTVGGWEVSVDYTRVFAKKYSEDRFKLELGRCF